MKLRYNYRLYPTKLQELNLIQAAGNTRFIWNYFLQENKITYEYQRKFNFYNEMSAELTKLKKKLPWLNLSYSQIYQAKLKDLDLALKQAKRGFPRFKSKWLNADSFRYTQNTSVSENRLHLPKIGDVKIKLHRDLPKYSSVSILKQNNKWYASFVVEKEEIPNLGLRNTIGVDVNANNIALSNGDILITPRPNRKYKLKLKQLQRNISRKKKKSNNRAKARLIYQKFCTHLKNIRKNFLHQISSRIAKVSGLVCTETLNIEQMKENHMSAICIADNGWRYLFDMLRYKCQLLGKSFHQINQWLASTQACYFCSNRKKMPVNVRVYTCKECGYVEDRDINAAKNIEKWGFQEFFGIKKGEEISCVDVVFGLLSSDMESSTQMKHEAKADGIS
jgi:putative transposase